MVKIDTKILLLLRDKMDLEYEIESLLENKLKKSDKIEFTTQLIEMLKRNYDEINEVENNTEFKKKQHNIFNQFIKKLYTLLDYFQEIEKSTVNINEILREIDIDLVLTYQCIDKNLNINFENYTWF